MEKAKAVVGHRLFKRACTLLAFLCGVALIPAGVLGFFELTLNVLNYVVCLYIVLGGASTAIACVPIPPVRAVVLNTMPFLATMNGRGAFLLLWGSLAVGTGWVGLVVGLITAVVGVFLLVVGIFFHVFIDKSAPDDMPWPVQTEMSSYSKGDVDGSFPPSAAGEYEPPNVPPPAPV
eukprot:TRINITY_DN3385_c0_g1_i2.p2 TRINITY_DN3385_c0_g1~~TRINITY_DN3385_c0_g1_i2.p2  ORF type:complete len:177 (+),score=57.19 TRINITY_DN3385_c0_g1_i2:175-705(+)